MEDIKLSKHDTATVATPPSTKCTGDDHESDADSATINSSISDELNDFPPTLSINDCRGGRTTHHRTPGPKTINSDSDSDADTDLLLTGHETDPFVLKKSFDNLRNRRRAASAAAIVTGGSTARQPSFLSKMAREVAGEPTTTTMTAAAAATHYRTSLLRRRKHDKSSTGGAQQTSVSLSSSPIVGARPLVTAAGPVECEIESGVELTEEMMFGGLGNSDGGAGGGDQSAKAIGVGSVPIGMYLNALNLFICSGEKFVVIVVS